MKTLIHNHSEHSVRDSAMKITQLVKVAKEKGYDAVALTDHGVLTGIVDFMKVCKKEGIKAIPGVETYYGDNIKTRRHLVLMAKNYKGYQAISKAVTQSNENKLDDFPRMNDEILKNNFGKGSLGYGNVVITSACIGGVIADIFQKNAQVDHEIAKLLKKQSKCLAPDDDFLAMKEEADNISLEIEKMISERDEIESISKTVLTGLKKAVKLAEGEEKADFEEKLEKASAEKEKAKLDLAEIKLKIASKKKTLSAKKKVLMPISEKVDKFIAVQDKIDELEESKTDDEVLYKEAFETCKKFVNILGEKNFFIELQYHEMEEELYTMPKLIEIGKELNLKFVVANDAHYATNETCDIRANALIRAMRFNTPVETGEDNPTFGELYIKDELELKQCLLNIVKDLSFINEVIKTTDSIGDMCDVEFPTDTHYPAFKNTETKESSAEFLTRLAKEGIAERYSVWGKEHQERFDYEIDIICKLGFADYLCIVQDFLNYARSIVNTRPEKTGYIIGPGRGSAAGSLICYLIGITDIDPIKYNLFFERFLNPERVSQPDIDSDFHREYRDAVVEYCKDKYGKDAICNILTKGTVAAKGAIKGVGRVTDIPEGVILALCELVPIEPGAKLSDIKEEQLQDVYKTYPIARKVMEDARLIEGTIVNYGMHAAGVILSDSADVSDYVPLLKNEGKWVAQVDMGQTEGDCGLLKFDFLGLKNIDILDETLLKIKKTYGKTINMREIPFEKEVFLNIFAKGETNCVFQFESAGMKSMLKQFKPDCIEDIILLVASYRPGPMDAIPKIVSNKHGRTKPEYICKGMEEILGTTYGEVIYQEQVMQICNKICGFTMGEADIVRKAMSKKKIEMLTNPKTDYKGRIIKGLVDNGAKVEQAEEFWENLLKFASYAFNKSHATAYAFVAYYTAYFKYHYPAQYLSSVMSKANLNDLPNLMAESKRRKVSFSLPNVNTSELHFSSAIDSNSIIIGFTDIKGLGNSGDNILEVRKDGMFTSFKNFVLRMSLNGGVNIKNYTSLILSGAFDTFGDSREALIKALPELLEIAEKIKKKTKAISELEMIEERDEKLEKRIENGNVARRKLLELYEDVDIEEIQAINENNLANEFGLLGAYISGHPLDVYDGAIKKIKKTNIANVDGKSKVTICGIISNVIFRQKKADGKNFAIFNLEDKTGTIEVKCFTKAFESFDEFVENGKVVEIKGKGMIQEDTVSVMVESISEVYPEMQETIYMYGNSIVDWVENFDKIQKFENPYGYELCFIDKALKSVRKSTFKVDKKIVNELGDMFSFMIK